jgi:hypothetical protein
MPVLGAAAVYLRILVEGAGGAPAVRPGPPTDPPALPFGLAPVFSPARTSRMILPLESDKLLAQPIRARHFLPSRSARSIARLPYLDFLLHGAGEHCFFRMIFRCTIVPTKQRRTLPSSISKP